MFTSQIQLMGFSGPVCILTCAHVSMSSLWHIYLTVWRRKALHLSLSSWKGNLSLERVDNLLIIHWFKTRAEVKPYRLQVSTWNLPCVSPWSWPCKHFSPLTQTSSSGLCAPWYLPVVAAVGRRGSEKPEELNICMKSEYDLGCRPQLDLQTHAGEWTFPWSSCRVTPRRIRGCFFKFRNMFFFPKGTTGRNMLFAKRVISETSRRKETKKEGHSF